jgi:serine protease Do
MFRPFLDKRKFKYASISAPRGSTKSAQVAKPKHRASGSRDETGCFVTRFDGGAGLRQSLKRNVWLMLGMVAVSSCGSFRRAGAKPGKLDAAAIATLGRPGSVLIQTWFEGNLQIPDIEVDENRLRAVLQAFLNERGGAATDQNLLAFFNALLPRLGGLSTQTHTYAIRIDQGSSGSGMILTPEGHVVTNAHVVDLDEEDLAKLLVRENPSGIARSVAIVEKVLSEANPQFRLSESRQNRLRNELLEAAAGIANVSGVKRGIRMLIPSRRNGRTVPEPLNCQVVVKGKGIPKKDVAVLTCQSNGNLPTVTLAQTSAQVSIGEDLYVIGYPGAATYNAALSRDSIVESSLTIGHVSALKHMADGWSVIQTDAAVTHGNSGGPAFNSQGQVIGIVTFGAVDSKGTEVAGFSYVVPADVIHEFLRSARVTPRMSRFSIAFNEASNAYYGGDADTAKKLLRKLDSTAFGGAYVRQLQDKLGVPPSATITTATAVATNRAAPSSPAAEKSTGVMGIVLYSLGALVGLGVLVFGFLFIRAWARW